LALALATVFGGGRRARGAALGAAPLDDHLDARVVGEMRAQRLAELGELGRDDAVDTRRARRTRRRLGAASLRLVSVPLQPPPPARRRARRRPRANYTGGGRRARAFSCVGRRRGGDEGDPPACAWPTISPP